MTRNLIALAILLSLAPFVRAQDMPLSQILIDGEAWKKTTGQPPASAFAFKSEETPSGKRQEYTIGSRKFTGIDTPESSKETKYQRHGVPTAGFVSRDGGTVFIGHDTGYIWAYQVQSDGALMHGHPYCPVRAQMERRKTDPTTSSSRVSSMTGDKDGRIYAATPLGVQVFDPTGRLCGVLTPAAPGKSEHLAFEGDKLTLWIGDTKYERKLNTSGVK
jgi:sugar lactone lactonase YvrE